MIPRILLLDCTGGICVGIAVLGMCQLLSELEGLPLSVVIPKWETPINLSRGHKAIAQFKKGAPDDHVSRLDLMMHFVEQTAAQTLECMHQDRR